ncbi:siderophore ABC transporter substrate-binding protein [Shimia biformata]|uniref:siderophore ABC transporter substrate-binding protein n=1 Tax=Shimia biformata TaxID=1294299 RepID=UPI00194F8CEC|nr:siderophore ABC transporter substrate-binding protein [Shimia biformata]
MFRWLAIAISIFASSATAQSVSVETHAGVIDAPVAPGKVVVLDIPAIDTLAALGVAVDGIVGPLYVDYLDQAVEGAEKVGSLFEPDYEKIAALRPDLIIAGGRSQAAIPDLSKLAPTLDMTIWEDTVGQSLARLSAYGAIFGKETEAAELKDVFETKLAAARNASTGKGKAMIVMTNGPKISAYGAAGRFGWIHTELGLAEAIDGMQDTPHGEAISFEFIRDANPDILLVIDRQAAIGQPGEAASVTLDNALVQETNAWKSGKVIYLDSARIYVAGGGYQALIHTFDQIATALAD